MDDKFKRLEDKIDLVTNKLEDSNDKLSSMDKNLAIYNEQLKVHIEGTIQNRDAIQLLNNKIEIEISPIKKHVNMIEGGLKLIGLVGVVVGIIEGFLKIIQ